MSWTGDRSVLRRCLLPEPAQVSDHNRVHGDHIIGGYPPPDRPLRPAAVLVPLVDRPQGWTVLLTRRTDHLHHHPGQISFPGGRAEEHDPHPVETALRETAEEIGLAPAYVQVAGYLDPYLTITGFIVTPVVGLVRPGFTLVLDDFEVAEAFEIPLEAVLDPANHRLENRLVAGHERRFYVIPYGDYYIWGATAAMLVSLARRLAG